MQIPNILIEYFVVLVEKLGTNKVRFVILSNFVLILHNFTLLLHVENFIIFAKIDTTWYTDLFDVQSHYE